MSPTSSGSEEVEFINEAPAPAAGTAAARFKILIVDDDKDVHLVTKQVLSTYFPKGDMPVFLHAYNSLDAYTILAWERDVAVVLLDVVMESDDAGLKLISSIRGDLHLSRTQIILRTGQPGLASEDKVIADYEINGYLAKSDLTPSKLYSAVTTARRAYTQLSKEVAAASSADAASKQTLPRAGALAMESFTLDSMLHIAALFKIPCMGFVLRRTQIDQPLVVNMATPEFAKLSGLSLEALRDEAFSKRVAACLQQRTSIIDKGAATLFLPGNQYPDAIMHFVCKIEGGPVENHLLDILVSTYVIYSELLLREARA